MSEPYRLIPLLLSKIVWIVLAITFLAVICFRILKGHTEQFGVDVDSAISLLATLNIIRFSIYLKDPKGQPELTIETISSVLGKGLHTKILNLAFVFLAFLALWAAVRDAGLATVEILQSSWLVSKYISSLLDSFSLLLVSFLSLSFLDLMKKTLDEPNAADKNTIQILLKTGIIAVLISLLELLPQITNIALYQGWTVIPNSTYLLPVILSVIIGSLVALVSTFYHLRARTD